MLDAVAAKRQKEAFLKAGAGKPKKQLDLHGKAVKVQQVKAKLKEGKDKNKFKDGKDSMPGPSPYAIDMDKDSEWHTMMRQLTEANWDQID